MHCYTAGEGTNYGHFLEYSLTTYFQSFEYCEHFHPVIKSVDLYPKELIKGCQDGQVV